MLKPMLCCSLPNPINTLQMVCGGASVVTTAMGTHNMITTIMNTAA
jgi:hypothetical protein